MDGWLLYLVTGGVVFVAAAVQGLIGFGFGLVSMAVLPLVHDLRFVVPLVCIFSFAVNGTLLVHLRPEVRWSRVAPLVYGAVVGLPIGVGFLHAANERLLIGTLGIIVVGYVLWQFLDRRAHEREFGDRWGVVAGVFGGALGGAFNTHGPPAVMWLAGKPWSPDAVKATLQGFFFVCTVVQTALYAGAGILTADVLQMNAILFVGVVAGVSAGSALSRRVDRDLFRRLMLSALLLLGVLYVAKSIRGG